jgi:hypothetical protein
MFNKTITLNDHDFTAGGTDVFIVKGAVQTNAVAISSFRARTIRNAVQLDASFRSNLAAERVIVYRGVSDAPLLRLTEVSPRNDELHYVDDTVEAGVRYRYQIGVVDADGEFLSPVETVTIPRIATVLEQNRPNPFNPVTTIRFSLATRERARLVVYGADGSLVRTLLDEMRDAGSHAIGWDGRDDRGVSASSGIYFYRLTAGKFSQAKRMVLLK